MFGKPKHKPAKAVAQPRDDKEAVKVIQGLAKMYPRDKYPHMWGGPVKKEKDATSVVKKAKQTRMGQSAALHNALTEDEIKKLGGK